MSSIVAFSKAVTYIKIVPHPNNFDTSNNLADESSLDNDENNNYKESDDDDDDEIMDEIIFDIVNDSEEDNNDDDENDNNEDDELIELLDEEGIDKIARILEDQKDSYQSDGNKENDNEYRSVESSTPGNNSGIKPTDVAVAETTQTGTSIPTTRSSSKSNASFLSAYSKKNNQSLDDSEKKEIFESFMYSRDDSDNIPDIIEQLASKGYNLNYSKEYENFIFKKEFKRWKEHINDDTNGHIVDGRGMKSIDADFSYDDEDDDNNSNGDIKKKKG